MIHLRTDWQGIQDTRQWMIEELEGLEGLIQDGGFEEAEDAVGALIKRIKKLAGVNPAMPALVHSSIEEDEPIFMVRAKDVVAPEVVRYWAERASSVGSDPRLVARVNRYADQMSEYRQARWGREGVHAPDAPELLEDYEVKSREDYEVKSRVQA